jgi:Trypsin-like peptidase domain
MAKKQCLEVWLRPHAIGRLLRRLERADILVDAGSESGFWMGLERCYYTVQAPSALQGEGTLWLTGALGLPFAASYISGGVVHVTGKNKYGDLNAATGFFINSNTIVTCAHVISDMTLDPEVRIGNTSVSIKNQLAHEKIDIGIIQLEQAVDIPRGVGWGKGEVLDEVIAMGYPPIPQTTATPLTVQRGEVTGYAPGTDGLEYMLFSSIARPGDSGGPLISRRVSWSVSSPDYWSVIVKRLTQ